MRDANAERETYQMIDSLRWPAMPDPKARETKSQVVWIWPRARIRAVEQVDPANAHGDGYLLFPFVLSVFDRQDRHILTVALEQTDYRVLAQLTGERWRDLSGDPKVYRSPLIVAVYDANGHEDFGPYEGPLERDTVFPILTEYVADRLELWEEAIRRPVDTGGPTA